MLTLPGERPRPGGVSKQRENGRRLRLDGTSTGHRSHRRTHAALFLDRGEQQSPRLLAKSRQEAPQTCSRLSNRLFFLGQYISERERERGRFFQQLRRTKHAGKCSLQTCQGICVVRKVNYEPELISTRFAYRSHNQVSKKKKKRKRK